MKQFILLIVMVMISMSQVSCALFSDSPEEAASSDEGDSSEVSEESQKLEDSDDLALDEEAAEKSAANAEDDLQADFPDEENVEDELSTQNQPEETPADEAPVAEKEETVDQTIEKDLDQQFSGPVKITALDYKANESGGTFVIQTDGPAEYTTEENSSTNQYIIEIKNATLPQQFKRPFNTKEFSGAIGLISAYKKPGTSDVRVVVQLKKPTAISVVQEGNSLLVVPGSAVASTPEPVIEADGSSNAEEPAVQMSEQDQKDALQAKTLDEFLMGDSKFYGKKISIELADGELRDVINFISEESGVNLILAEEVRGKISLKLRQIPWDQALVLVMQSKQLGYIRQGNVLRVAPMSSIRAEADAAKQLIEAQKNLEPLRVKIFPISYAKANELASQVQGFLSSRGTSKPDDRTNNLVVRDIAENITKVEKLLQKLDTETPQVYIEARIIESAVNISSQIGFQWDKSGTVTLGYDIQSGVTTTGVAALTASLRLLEGEDKIKILSSPRIVTLNNKPATIQQTTQFPTFKQQFDAASSVTTKSVEYKSVTLSLNVTPQITSDGGVILQAAIARDYAGAVDATAPETGARPLNSRTANSTILVKNGQTAVLGGIYSTDNTEARSGIPLLRKIPFLEWIFGLETQTYGKNELVIFLSPRILNKDKAFQMGSSSSDTDSL